MMQSFIWALLTWWFSGFASASVSPPSTGDALTESCDVLGNCGEIRPGFDPHG